MSSLAVLLAVPTSNGVMTPDHGVWQSPNSALAWLKGVTITGPIKMEVQGLTADNMMEFVVFCNQLKPHYSLQSRDNSKK